MKTPEQWLEEFAKQGVGLGWSGWMMHASDRDKYYFMAMIEQIQKDAVDEGLTRALTELRSFLHNELHKVNFGH